MYDYQKIGFGNKDYYVVDRFTYGEVEYLYLYEDIYEEGKTDEELLDRNIEVNFIYKTENGKYTNVVDDKLFDKLMLYASRRLVENKNPFMQENKK